MGQPGTPIHLRLLYQALQYRGSLALAVFVLAGSSVLTILTPALAGYAIDTGLNVVEITGSGVVSVP